MQTMKPHHIILLILLALPLPATAAGVQISAHISQQDIYQGQPFGLTINVEGADEINQAEQIQFEGFDTKLLGQSQNSSIVITNGSRTSSNTIELSFQLTAQSNSAVIPAVTVIADGTPYSTTPIAITMKQPEEHDDFKLEIRLSKPTAYVGEPLLMTTTWLIGQKTRGGGFNLPVLNDPRFTVVSREDLLPSDQNQLIKIELAGEIILARKYQKRVNNRDFIAITFFHTLIPKTTGELTLPEASLAISNLAGYTSPSSRRMSDPFALFNNRQREVYSTIVIPANPVHLKVLPLPTDNVPPSFNGLVGTYTIEASASPTTVNIGDPISLKLVMTGEAANTIGMPPLTLDQFKISKEPPKHSATNDEARFTTTIRATTSKATSIPAIELAFFNVESGQYETVHTDPIAITVRPTRIITAKDALGGTPLTATTATSVPEIHQGIHYNYSDIQDETPSTPAPITLWLGIGIPPLLFLVLVLVNRDHNPSEKAGHRRKKRALRQLKKDLKTLPPFEAWLVFLGNELGRNPQTITRQDVLPKLISHPELQQQVLHLFKAGEAVKYGGADQNLGPQNIITTASLIHKVLP